MRVAIPTIEVAHKKARLAPRPETLDGKVLGIFDGWGDGRPGKGADTMYPLLKALTGLFTQEFRLARTVYVRKGTILGVPPRAIDEFGAQVEVAINGEGI